MKITIRPDANDRNADWLINRAKRKARGKPPGKGKPGLRPPAKG